MTSQTELSVPVEPKTPGAWATILPAGDIDVVTSPGLFDQVMAAWTETGLSVVVDFTNVTFVGAAGIHALVQARNELAASDCEVTVRYPSPLLAQILHRFALSDLLESERSQSA